MLIVLNVKNLAIIENITIDFKAGMTVLTGETGAGKSLIIDAVGLLFGNRATSDLIRHGQNKATIEGVFDEYTTDITDLLEQYGIEYAIEECLMIKRELYENGKNICRINNQTVSLSQLKEISQYIGDIHSQFDSLGLINPKNYLSFLKNKTIETFLVEYQTSLQKYRSLSKKYQDLLKVSTENIQQKDFLEYQIKELKKANLNKNEEDELKKELLTLNNFETINQQVSTFQKIYKDGLLDSLFSSLKIVEKLAQLDDSFNKHLKTIEECYYNLEAVCDEDCFKINSDSFDEKRLEDINLRLGVYSDLKRKYKLNVQELLDFQKEIEDKLYSIDNCDEILQNLQVEIKESWDETYLIAQKIRNERLKLAQKLVLEIQNELVDLQLPNTIFKICFNDFDHKNVVFHDQGIDVIDFLISFNPGEPLKPLAKTASGGELSRFMLALKTVLNEQIKLQIKIFDEIDAGISGNIAFSVARKLVKLANNSQVVCITHLPQVASKGENHFKILKKVINERTITNIVLLDYPQRIIEIASMISEGKPTDASIKLAEELLGTITKI